MDRHTVDNLPEKVQKVQSCISEHEIYAERSASCTTVTTKCTVTIATAVSVITCL